MALPVAFVCLGAAVSGLAYSEAFAPAPFGHYQPILDRMPFGAPVAELPAAAPAEPVVDVQAKAEQQKLASKICMSAVTVTPDGRTAIGFTDISQNPPINHFLLVGASSGGWTVVDADYDAETSTIEKEGVTITLQLGKGLIDGCAAQARTAPTPTGGRLAGAPQSPARPGALMSAALGRGSLSYAERLRERAAQESQARLAADSSQRAQLETIAREAAASEIRRREQEPTQADAPPAQ